MTRPPLRQLLAEARSGVLVFSITPPRRSATEERIKEIAEVTLDRLSALDLDGLILYDIDDESDRNPDDRPFPYLPTLDAARYYADHLTGWRQPVIVYRCVGKYPEDELREWMTRAGPEVLSVFVGASSGGKSVHTSLRRAHELRAEFRPDLPLGAVAIGERTDEHLRMLAKQDRGASFFVSQVVYHVNETKNLLSDYFYECRARGAEPRTVIFTLSLCGSLKTLEFVRWLGVDVPRWLENSIRHSADPLAESYRQCVAIARDLIDFCEHLGLPYGFNIESVSIRKAEIEASTDLAAEVAGMLRDRR
ncbi:5,10-methylenetetrahydrofolate reductase [Actinoplanes sp. NEAU-A12]|uniref:5,10-methylenetetrahydrofolate reductase n=1 Tax=Actinoplanes sandaracinus TaxID=3045177 RepID=A0ABT6WER9_9ACTN|nr:5,10-methylenetetrahydrofolate reductase [Actinoplanes sandaracinus]MDI6098235.1 5,10-methylenetetrahydrofolate reductase [Actinoplanes sandaracinus]